MPEMGLTIASVVASCWQGFRTLPQLAEKIPENSGRLERWW